MNVYVVRFGILVFSCMALFACNKQTPSGMNYQCDNGVTLSVEYINTGKSLSALLIYGGRVFDMYETRAASGAKYATEQGLSPEYGLIWWSQGNEGMLIQMIKDHTISVEDYPIIAKCVQS